MRTVAAMCDSRKIDVVAAIGAKARIPGSRCPDNKVE